MIELRGVGYRYPDTEEDALSGVDLEISEGEWILVAGASGCGKSSLLRVLNGLVPHFHGGVLRGRVRVAGRDPAQLGPRGMSDLVGFVHQNPEAHFVMRVVEDELAFAMENHGVEPATMARRVEEVLDQLAIAHLRDREIDTLSGGERQRVAIASVLTLQPRILVLDEPTSQLDPQSTREVLAALRTLNEDLGLTLLVSEHRLERVASLADRVLRLEDGRVAAFGPPEETLYGSPLAPPLVQLCDLMGWRPATLTLKSTRRRPEFRRLLEGWNAESAGVSGGEAAASASEPAIHARGLWWTFPEGTEALKGLTLKFDRGSLTALLGRNGAGKSTLLKSLVGLLRPERGRVELRPEPERRVDPHSLPLDRVAQDVGFVPQNPSRLLFHDSVDEELAWSLKQRRRGVSQGDLQNDPQGDSAGSGLDELIDVLGLEGLGERNPRELSTGERQRVALATALAGAPPILLLDEPTRGLDAAFKIRLGNWLRRLRDRGVTIVLATHDVELVARCADHVVLLGGGRVVSEGPTRPILHGSPVFSTQIHRLFGDERIHTLDDVRRWLLRESEAGDGEPDGDSGGEPGGEPGGEAA